MANKQKTRVVLPGGIQGLVRNLQNGTNDTTPQVDVSKIAEDTTPHDDTPAAKAGEPEHEPAVSTASAADDKTLNSAGAQTVQTVAQSAPEAPRYAEPQYAAPQYAEPQQSVAQQPVAAAAGGAGESDDQRPARGRRPKENTMKEYTVVKDDSRDSWDLFLDMAKQYKDGGGKLATIYIDESLKNVLDRMKYCGPEKLSTSAILSSIVARFIFDHEDDIKRVMFSGRLI